MDGTSEEQKNTTINNKSDPDCKIETKITDNIQVTTKKVEKQNVELNQCKKCNKYFKGNGNFWTHEKYICGKEKTLKCSQCDKRFHTRNRVINHLKFVHKLISELNYDNFVVQITEKNTNKEMIKIQPENQVEKNFKCEFCSYKTHIKRYLTDHAKKRHNISAKLFFSKKIIAPKESEEGAAEIRTPEKKMETSESKITSKNSNLMEQKGNVFNFDENTPLKVVKREILIRKKRYVLCKETIFKPAVCLQFIFIFFLFFSAQSATKIHTNGKKIQDQEKVFKTKSIPLPTWTVMHNDILKVKIYLF